MMQKIQKMFSMLNSLLIVSLFTMITVGAYSICNASGAINSLETPSNLLLTKGISFVFGLVITVIFMEASTSIIFGLFNSQINFEKKTGPFGLIGICVGFIYFLICFVAIKILYYFMGQTPLTVGVTQFFEYASWVTIIRMLLDPRGPKAIDFGILFGYVIIYFTFYFLLM